MTGVINHMFKKDFLFLKNKKVMGSAGVLVLVFAVGTIAVVKSPAQTGNKIENKIENVIESNH